jgi:hypothetical protein
MGKVFLANRPMGVLYVGAHFYVEVVHSIRNEHRAASFDHLVGRRYGQPERLCGPEVDDQLEFGRQLDRQVTAPARPQ